MANTLNTPEYIAKRFALALDKKLGALQAADKTYPCDRSDIGKVTLQIQLSPQTGTDFNELPRDELDAKLEQAAASFAERLLQLPGLTFRKMEIPQGVWAAAQVDLRGLIVRALPIYDAHEDQSHVLITMSYS